MNSTVSPAELTIDHAGCQLDNVAIGIHNHIACLDFHVVIQRAAVLDGGQLLQMDRLEVVVQGGVVAVAAQQETDHVGDEGIFHQAEERGGFLGQAEHQGVGAGGRPGRRRCRS